MKHHEDDEEHTLYGDDPQGPPLLECQEREYHDRDVNKNDGQQNVKIPVNDVLAHGELVPMKKLFWNKRHGRVSYVTDISQAGVTSYERFGE
jgi:hypothetical protein